MPIDELLVINSVEGNHLGADIELHNRALASEHTRELVVHDDHVRAQFPRVSFHAHVNGLR